jgi:hypothetical protein
MIPLSAIIEAFEADYLAHYAGSILPSQRKALAAMKICRTSASPMMQAQCTACDHPQLIPHSCGHRSCPHCQHHESQQWLERQRQRRLPATYFLITFTLPAALRPLAWGHQRALYRILTRCAWETVRAFTRNDRRLNGEAGAITVLHTVSGYKSTFLTPIPPIPPGVAFQGSSASIFSAESASPIRSST